MLGFVNGTIGKGGDEELGELIKLANIVALGVNENISSCKQETIKHIARGHGSTSKTKSLIFRVV